MVSNYSDSGQQRWLADRGIDLLRGTGRLAGPGVIEVDGVWGTREATSMKAVPRRLLVLGRGPAGVELARVVRRLGGEAVIVEGAGRVVPREPAALGEALGEALRRDGIELALGKRAAAAHRDSDDYVLGLDDGTEVRG